MLIWPETGQITVHGSAVQVKALTGAIGSGGHRMFGMVFLGLKKRYDRLPVVELVLCCDIDVAKTARVDEAIRQTSDAV